ncbi:MAG: type VI secretion system tip protein TssI/VgrG [Polyangiaceae bacterium]
MVAQVLADYREVTPPQRLTEAPGEREYTVQYKEADFELMQRVLAEDGYAFYFSGARLDQLLLVADTAAHPSRAHARLPVVAPAQALLGDEDVVQHLAFGPSLRPGVQIYRDYSFRNHLFHPTATARDDGGFAVVELLGASEYQEGVLHEQGTGDTTLLDEEQQRVKAGIRLTERRSRHQILTAELSCMLPAGAVLTLDGDGAPERRDYTVVRAVTLYELGTEDGEERHRQQHRVECLPQDFPYRPPPPPKPRIHGLQRATVIGDQEIDVDEHGRVLVLFQWDERDQAWRGPPDPFPSTDFARRIQAAQDWAGPNRGFVTLPRLGDEVAVAFIDGDPDQPVVVGQLYNGVNRSALRLPDDRTQSVWRSRSSPDGDGFHEIRFEDKAGAEELHIEAERLHTRLVKGSEQIAVGGDRQIDVGGDQTVTIRGDLEVEATNITFEAEGKHIILADRTKVESASRSERTKGAHVIEAGSVTVRAGEIVLQVGGSAIRITSGGIVIQGPVVDINP